MPETYALIAIASHLGAEASAPKGTSHFPSAGRGGPEQAARSDNDNGEQQPPDHHLHGVAAEEVDRKRFDQSDDQSAGDRSPNRSNPAQYHGGDRFGADIVAHKRRHSAVVNGEERAGDSSQQASQDKNNRHDLVDFDAE